MSKRLLLKIASFIIFAFIFQKTSNAQALFSLTPSLRLLPSDTTSITLSLSTELNADCRWSETPSTPFASMTNNFTTGQGTTTHSTDIGNWTTITKRTFYIRCDDATGERDPDSMELSTSLRKMGAFDSGFPRTYSQWGGWDETLGADYYAGLNVWLSWWSTATYQSRANAVRAINPKTKVIMTQDATYGSPGHLWDSVYTEWLNSAPEDPGYPCMFRNTSGTILTNGTYGNPMYNMTNSYCVTQLVNQNVNYWNTTNLAFDGIFWDMMGTTITGTIGPNIDSDLDGIADDTSTLNAAYSAGVVNFLTQVRAGIPNAIFIGNDSPTSYGTWENGRYIESETRDYLDDYYPTVYEDIIGYYQLWSNTGVAPRITNLATSATMSLPNKYGPLIPNMPAAMKTEASQEYKRMRFGLGSALFGDGTYSYDMGPYYYGFNWWYDEYGTQEDYTTTGYLGQPVSDAARVSDTLSTSDDVTNGDFSSDKTNWLLETGTGGGGPATWVIDGTGGIDNSKNAHITVPAGISTWVALSQRDFTTSTGTYYTLSFWAKANSARNVSFRIQNQDSPYNYLTSSQFNASLTTEWKQFHRVLKATGTTANNGRLVIDVGVSRGEIYFDNFQFQEGTMDVWSREFDNGRVIVNASPEVHSVNLSSLYGHAYKKLNGTQAPLWYTRVDDDETSTVVSGSWTDTESTDSSFPNQFGDSFKIIAGPSPASTVTYSPTIAYDGDYEVLAWVAPLESNSTGVTVTINHAGESDSVNLDETAGSIGWHSLGTFNFDTISNSSVVFAATGSGNIVADAIKLNSVARYNDGSEITEISVQPKDAIILLNETTPPTVTINQAAGQADPTTETTINFTVEFSETVTDFATGDVTISGTAGATTAVVTGSGTTYNVAVSGMTGEGTVVASIAQGVAEDSVGNLSNASTSTDNSVTFEIVSAVEINRIWAVDDSEKILKSDLDNSLATDPNNSVWDGDNVNIFSGKNEVVSFQLIIESGESGASNVNVSLDSLSSADFTIDNSGATAPGDPFNYVGKNIEIFKEHYINVTERTDTYDTLSWGWSGVQGDYLGYVPDALIPLQTGVDIGASSNQGIWFDIYVPENATSGVYTGNISVTKGGTNYTTIPVILKVYNFTIPDQVNLKNWFYFEPFSANDFTSRFNTTYSYSNETYKTIETRFYQMAHRHRMDLVHSVNLSIMDSYLKKYYNGTAYTSGSGYAGPGVSVGNGTYSIGTYSSWRGGFPALVSDPGGENCNESGWQTASDSWVNWFSTNAPNTEYFLYVEPDEPTPSNYQSSDTAYITHSNWIHNNPGVGQSLKIYSTVGGFALNDSGGINSNLTSAVDYWAMAGMQGYFHPPASYWGGTYGKFEGYMMGYGAYPNYVDQIKALGKKTAIYNGVYPYMGSSTLIDADATINRVNPWIAWRYDVDQYFQYHINKYDTRNPFTNNYALVNTSDGEKKRWGGGTMFYPGSDHMFPESDLNLDGPIASIRMKNWRRGEQDYEYLWLTSQAGKSSEADNIAQTLVPTALSDAFESPSNFPTNLNSPASWPTRGYSFENSREQLALLLDAPVLTSISISDTSGHTNDATPEISIVSSNSPEFVSFSCNAGSNWSDWIAYSDTISTFNITNGAAGCTSSEGSKTITAKLKSALDTESETTSDTTIYDISGPILTSITISDLSGYTNDLTPIFTIVSSGSPTHIAFSCNSGSNWSDWIVYSDTISNFDITNGASGCSTTNESKTITVKLKDSENNESSTANDTTYFDNISPTTPSTLATTSPSTDTTPTWTWAASTDSGDGLTNPAYVIEWSLDSGFLTGISSAPSNTLSYTHQSALSIGTWYARVKSTDLAGNPSSYSDSANVVVESAPDPVAFSISEISAVASNNTVTVTWTTDTLASSQLDYGLTASYGTSTPESDISTRVTAHTVQVTTLSKCKTYHYRVKGKNASEVEVIGEDKTFTTTGCSSSSSKKSSSKSSGGSNKSKESSVNGPITLTKINSVNISPQLTESSSMWINYYSSSSRPWFYGTGEKTGTKVKVYTWSNIKLCETVVSGGVWGCVPEKDMEIKTHRIDIQYGSKLLPPFNLKIGGGSAVRNTPAAQTTRPNSTATTTAPKPAVTPVSTKPSSDTVFGKLLNKQIKGDSDVRDLDNNKLNTAKKIVGILIVVNILVLAISILWFGLYKLKNNRNKRV